MSDGLPGPAPEEIATRREMDKHGGEQKQQYSPANSSHPSRTVYEDHHSPEAHAAGGERENGGPQSIKPRWTPYERSTIIVQVFTLLALIAYTVVNYHMWQSMNAANEQARKSSESTKQIIDANKALADAARDSVAETKRLADAAQTANAQALKTSAGQRRVAQESLSEAKSSLVISQRAWLSLKGFAETAPPAPDKPFQTSMIIENVGKSPAQDVQPVMRLIVSRFGNGNQAPPLSILDGPVLNQSSSVVGSGQMTILVAEPLTIPRSYYDQIMSGELKVFIVARIRYRDIFGTDCETRVCSVFQLSNNLWHPCLGGNFLR